MGDHSPHLSARDQFPHLREKPAQMQIPVKKHHSINGHFKPEAADPLSLPGDLHEQRRHLAPFQFMEPPARIGIPIERHAPVQDDENVDVGMRGFPAVGKGAEQCQCVHIGSPDFQHPGRQLLQQRRPARAAARKCQRDGSCGGRRLCYPPAENGPAVLVERQVSGASFLLQPLMQSGWNAKNQSGAGFFHLRYDIMIAD